MHHQSSKTRRYSRYIEDDFGPPRDILSNPMRDYRQGHEKKEEIMLKFHFL
jgi:hypothetical protein